MGNEYWCAYHNQSGDTVTLQKKDLLNATERWHAGTDYDSDRDLITDFQKGCLHEFGDSREEALAALARTEERLKAGEIVTSSLWW